MSERKRQKEKKLQRSTRQRQREGEREREREREERYAETARCSKNERDGYINEGIIQMSGGEGRKK